MYLVLALLLILVLLWFLGVGNALHFNASLHAGGGLKTLLIVVLVVAVIAVILRRF